MADSITGESDLMESEGSDGKNGFCIGCGYSLRGLKSTNCPECGLSVFSRMSEQNWSFQNNLKMAILGLCSGFVSLFMGIFGPGIFFAFLVILPLGIRQRFSAWRILMSIIASIGGYSVAFRLVDPLNPGRSLGDYGLFVSFSITGIAGMFVLSVILFWRNPKRIALSLIAAVFASLVFAASVYIFPETDSMIYFGVGVWQCIMAFALSVMLKKKVISGGGVAGDL